MKARVRLDPSVPIWFTEYPRGKRISAVDLGYDEMLRNQDHEVIYTDGNIALTTYECCYGLVDLTDGTCRGSLWDSENEDFAGKGHRWKTGAWRMTEEDRIAVGGGWYWTTPLPRFDPEAEASQLSLVHGCRPEAHERWTELVVKLARRAYEAGRAEATADLVSVEHVARRVGK